MFIKIGANKHRMRHKPAPECPAVNASACCGNLDNLKEFPAIGGERCLAIAVLIYGSGTQRASHLASGTSKRRFTRLRGKINCDLSCHAGLDPASSGFRFVPTSIVKQKPTPPGSGSEAGAAEGR